MPTKNISEPTVRPYTPYTSFRILFWEMGVRSFYVSSMYPFFQNIIRNQVYGTYGRTVVETLRIVFG